MLAVWRIFQNMEHSVLFNIENMVQKVHNKK